MDTVALLGIIAGLVLLVLWDQKRLNKPPTPKQQPSPPNPEASADRSAKLDDPFLDDIKQLRAHAETEARSRVKHHERELANQFDEDVALKKRLAAFAQAQKLDRALVDLWDEIRHYASWKRNGHTLPDHLPVHDVDDIGTNNDKKIAFVFEDCNYLIQTREWHGMEYDSYVDLTLYEQDDEVFAITTSVDHGQHMTYYNPTSVNAFRKQGKWAQLLIICQAAIAERSQKTSAQLKYYKADEIKDRFKE